jgi:hypothetical protein
MAQLFLDGLAQSPTLPCPFDTLFLKKMTIVNPSADVSKFTVSCKMF